MKSISNTLLKDLTHIIEQGKQQVTAQVNSTLTLVYWQVGNRINNELLNNQRATYGKEVISKLANVLIKNHGRNFSERNLRRMIQFAEVFPDLQILTPVVSKLSWSHFILLFPIKDSESRLFYIKQSIEQKWSKRELQKQIERKAFERKEIAKVQLLETTKDIQTTFKDPYFLDFLGIKDGYLENDLETAILKELESFILSITNPARSWRPCRYKK